MTFKFPPTWVTVSIGLMLNVMAIVLSSQVLDKMTADLTVFADKKASNLYSIQLAWNQVETLERKREGLLLHLDMSLAGGALVNTKIKEQLVKELTAWTTRPVPAISTQNLSELMRVINQSQQAQRDIIDDLYLDNLTLVEEMQATEKEMALFKDIALFLQVFGLALILARDLSRN
ncbi:DNA mismatch repair protein [Vibrio sp. ZSDZ65]|uniref:DNA mismatch repair protein n=1 Tax=Vibrio qingdaonensis TaxID=2829491 RepID=A0A9X3CR01_9VIBR|nr:DNA mismatch repair protein [Vibrio qingdaonensis]MCW8347909.1 DNA mismatch repair protein [Vibrio qingdaonensis]